MLTSSLLKKRSLVSVVQDAGEERLEQYIDDAETRIELFLPVPFPEQPDKHIMLAWTKLAESLALQDSEEYLAAVARNYASESDGAWTYTRQSVHGKTTGNVDVDAILSQWISKRQNGSVKAYVL